MATYYNDNDSYVAEWLGNLIATGHLPSGAVDDRSILDIDPDELGSFRQCHFFAGIGGWPYALRLADWPEDRECWTASCPCQPLSSAGQRKGHADERHLWPALFRLIAECRPATIFGEQVASKDGFEWLAGVRADLEAEGYAVGAANLTAAGAGAFHIRQRLFWVAHANFSDGYQRPLCGEQQKPDDQRAADRMADSSRARHEHDARGVPGSERAQTGWSTHEPQHGCTIGGVADADQGQRRRIAIGGGSERDRQETRRLEGNREPQPSSPTLDLGDAELSGRSSRQPGNIGAPISEADSGAAAAWPSRANGSSGMGDSDGEREKVPRRFPGRQGTERVRSPWAEAEWINCRDGKARPIEPGTFPLAHGVPARVGRLRAYGNAIVPQVAAEFIKAFMEWAP